jgi:hypothetical protein
MASTPDVRLPEVEMSSIAIAVVLAGTILVASMISVEVGFSVALIELFLGVVVGNIF